MSPLAELVSSGAAQLIVAVLGGGGIVGLFVSLVKLRPETDSLAVSQATGAMETMVELNRVLKEDLDACRKRCSALQVELGHALDLLAQFEERWGPLEREDRRSPG